MRKKKGYWCDTCSVFIPGAFKVAGIHVNCKSCAKKERENKMTEAEKYAKDLLKKYGLSKLDIPLSDDIYKTTGQVVKAVLPEKLWREWVEEGTKRLNDRIQERNLNIPLWDLEESWAEFLDS